MTAVSYEPRTGWAQPAPSDSSTEQIAQTVAVALAAADVMADSSPRERAGWLNAIAVALRGNADALCEIADAETALGLPRLTGELERAATALHFYAEVGIDASWLDATIDSATDSRPDLRRVNRSLGPIAVFGASNFPFGFGVLGHDTASGIAAGCPVLVKGHPAHPRLSTALANVAHDALRRVGAPVGAFGIVFGFDSGTALVTHPGIEAVAFTGSETGGMALWRLAATRERVIPVYAEMGTVNTAVVTRAAAAERPDEIAAGFVASFTMGMGQFCTKPGLLLAPSGAEMPARVGAALHEAGPQGWMLTEGIANAYAASLREFMDAGATVTAEVAPLEQGWVASPTVLSVDSGLLRAGSRLLAECFGPVALVSEYEDEADLEAILAALPGSLAAAVHGGREPDASLAPIVHQLSRQVGRVVANGWPTGVAVTWAQQHGGPWPATTSPSATSVGAAALRRFVRPVAYQDVPDEALPPALRAANPWHLPRRVDGRANG
jgi:NADP-dependent aldehyde dehydrogenase